MAIFDSVDFDNHEQVVYCSDDATGLKAIIAVHSTTLGPAAGGCRFWVEFLREALLQSPLGLGVCMGASVVERVVVGPSRPGPGPWMSNMQLQKTSFSNV